MGLRGDLKVGSLPLGGRSTKLYPLCAPSWGAGASEAAPWALRIQGGSPEARPHPLQQPRLNARSHARLVPSSPTPPLIRHAGGKLQTWSPGGNWRWEAYLETWRRLGEMDHARCCSRSRAPSPAHNSSIPSSSVGTKVFIVQSYQPELSSELGSTGPVHVELGCRGWQRVDTRLGPRSTHIWEAPPQHQSQPFYPRGPQRAEEKGGVKVNRATRVYSLSSPVGRHLTFLPHRG